MLIGYYPRQRIVLRAEPRASQCTDTSITCASGTQHQWLAHIQLAQLLLGRQLCFLAFARSAARLGKPTVWPLETMQHVFSPWNDSESTSKSMATLSQIEFWFIKWIRCTGRLKGRAKYIFTPKNTAKVINFSAESAGLSPFNSLRAERLMNIIRSTETNKDQGLIPLVSRPFNPLTWRSAHVLIKTSALGLCSLTQWENG